MSTTQSPTPGRRLAFRVTNSGLSAVHVRVEPWAREYDLSAGATCEFMFAGPDPADVEVEIMPTAITIYGWAGSVLDGIGLPVPSGDYPPGDIPAR